jgi:hypothetical protein
MIIHRSASGGTKNDPDSAAWADGFQELLATTKFIGMKKNFFLMAPS